MDTNIINEVARERDADRQRWLRLYSSVMQSDPPGYMTDEEIAQVTMAALARAMGHLVQAHRSLDEERSHQISIDRLAQELTGVGAPAIENTSERHWARPLDELNEIRAQLTEERIARAREQGETSRAMASALRSVTVASEEMHALIRSGAHDTGANNLRRQGAIVASLSAAMADIGGCE